MLQKFERADGNANLGLAGIVNRNAAGTLFSEGRFDEAAKMTATNTEQARRHYPNSIALAVRLLNHGLLLMEVGQYAEAAHGLRKRFTIARHSDPMHNRWPRIGWRRRLDWQSHQGAHSAIER